jgi:hypothetical protein
VAKVRELLFFGAFTHFISSFHLSGSGSKKYIVQKGGKVMLMMLCYGVEKYKVIGSCVLVEPALERLLPPG